MTDEEFKREVESLVEKRHSDNPILSKFEELNETDLLRVLNASYIAERFFGRSKSWFSQKINGHVKNGKPCAFTPKELETLSNALHTIAIELQDLADELH